MICWYCGIEDAPNYEREHQLPIVRGGMGQGDVWACRPCNRLKGSATVDEFRARLAQALGQDVAFAGEKKSPDALSADIARAREILKAQRVLKLTGSLAGELVDAVMFLRATGLCLSIRRGP